MITPENFDEKVNPQYGNYSMAMSTMYAILDKNSAGEGFDAYGVMVDAFKFGFMQGQRAAAQQQTKQQQDASEHCAQLFDLASALENIDCKRERALKLVGNISGTLYDKAQQPSISDGEAITEQIIAAVDLLRYIAADSEKITQEVYEIARNAAK